MVGLGTRSAIERAESGNSQPKAARASALPDRQRRASRFSGRTYGRDSGLTNRIHETPENCATSPTLSGDGVQQRVALDRPGVLTGSLSPDPDSASDQHA